MTPFRTGFAAELLKVASRRGENAEHLLRRAATWGALGGAGLYTGQKAMAMAGAAEDPAYTGNTLLGTTAKTSLGALLAAGVLKAVNHLGAGARR